MKLQEYDFKFTEEEGKHLFFTSDTHFFHNNIIRYCKRPYETPEEMNEDFIKRWNEVITDDDTVFHLGDVVFGSSEKWESILSRLKGKKVLLYGNHDQGVSTDILDKYFIWHGKQAKIKIGHHIIYLQHFPYLCFDGAWNGAKATWQLFGHVHTSEKCQQGLDVQRMKLLFPCQYDVGVDNNNYTPVSFTKVKEIIIDQLYSLNLIK